MPQSKAPAPELAAWREFCRRIESHGEEILPAPYPRATPAGLSFSWTRG